MTRRTLGGAGAMLAAAWSALAVAACGTAADRMAAQAPAKLAPATLRMLFRGGQYEVDMYAQRMPVFEQQYPGVKVELESTAGGDQYTKAVANAAAGTSTDLIWSSVGSGGYFSLAAQKITRSIDDVVSRDKFDLKQFYETAMKSLRWQNKLFGVPVLCHPSISMIWFNQSRLDSVTNTMPDKSWTLDQLLELCRRLTRDTGDVSTKTWGYSVYTAPRGIKCMARAWGGETFSADGKKSLFSTEPVVNSVTWIYEMMHKHRVSPTPDDLRGVQGGLNTLFGTGQSPMTRSSTSFLQTALQQVKPPAKFWAAPHPKPAGANTNNGSAWECDVWTMASTTKYPEHAWKLMVHLSDKESGLVLAKLTGSLNGRVDVWHAPEILNSDPIRKVMLDAMESAQPWTTTYNTRFVEYEARMTELLAPVWSGQQAPTKSYMEEGDRQLQQILDPPRPGASLRGVR
jgi:ABC-type glycerol-3-phosphate transport system substrate-binding protein